MARISTLLTAATVAVLPFFTNANDALAQTATEAPLNTDGLSLGEEAETTRKVGDSYTTDSFGDWTMRCIVVAEGEDPCQMYQLLSDSNGQPIAEFTMFKLPESGEAKAGATIIVPLETSLAEQLTIQVDDQTGKRYPLSFCNQIGCYARIGLTEEDVSSYKRGAQAVLSIVPIAAPDQRVNVILSLDGFTAAYENASVLLQQ